MSARDDVNGRFGNSRVAGGVELQRLGELRNVEPDDVGADRERGGGSLERPGLARDGAERDDGDGLAGGLRGPCGSALKSLAAISRSGPTPGTPSLIRAWIRRASPSATRGWIGAEPDERVARGQLPRGGPAHHLAPEPVVVGVADPVPPAPGAVGADPEDLAQPVRLRGDHGGRVVAGRRGQHGRPGLCPARDDPGEPGQARPDRPVLLGVGGELEHRPGGNIQTGGRRQDGNPGRQDRVRGVGRAGIDRDQPRARGPAAAYGPSPGRRARPSAWDRG